MSRAACCRIIRTSVILVLILLSATRSVSPTRLRPVPAPTSDRVKRGDRVETYANHIIAAFQRRYEGDQLNHRQKVRFSEFDLPLGSNRTQVPSVPKQSWSHQQARALARLRWQSGKRLQAQAREGNGTIRFLKGWRLQQAALTPRAGKSLAETTALQCLERNVDLFNIDDPVHEWRLTGSRRDDLNLTQVTFSQAYEGLEVWPSSLTVQLNEKGHAEQVYAAYVPTPSDVETIPGLSEAQARSMAIEFLRSQWVPVPNSPSTMAATLLIHAPVTDTPRLAYSVQAHHASGSDWRVFIDAHTGEVLSALNQICSAAVKGSGIDALGHVRSIDLWSENNSYAMVDTTKSMFDSERSAPPGLKTTFGGIFVYDANNVSPNQKILPYTPSLISSGNRDSGFGPEAVSASIYLSHIYDYYETQHDRLSIDGSGGNIIGVVNIPIANAYWQDGIISLGNIGNYASALDVVSHEVTHGVIEHTADLIFRDQSGALSEAFSDIFGEAAEAFRNQASPDWIVGSRLAKPLRNLKSPGSIEIVPGRPYPSRMSEFITPSDPLLATLPGRDNGGVHLNSTIISHAFYQLVEGLPESIGLNAAERIFYRALTTKLQKQAQFVDCRIACVRSAEELFGLGSAEARRTAEALSVVEILDQIPLPDPQPVPIVEGQDLVLFTFVDPFDGQTYLGRAAPGDTLSDEDTSILDIPVAPDTRPAVSRDGSLAIAVTADFRVVVIDPIAEEAEVILEPDSVWSVGLSSDGRYVGVVLANEAEPLNTIDVIDIATEWSESYPITAPTREGSGTDTVDFVDSITFTADGQSIYCDGVNSITFSDGDAFGTWNIYSVDLQTKSVVSVFPNSSGGNFANPSLGRAYVDHLLYETEDIETGNSLIYVKDLTSGVQLKVGESTALEGLAFPDFFGDDGAILYSDYPLDGSQGGLFRQRLANDGLAPIGTPALWYFNEEGGAIIGAVFRRGSYEGLNIVDVAAEIDTLMESDGTAQFSLQRSGPTSEPLTVQFVTVGTAVPGRDYLPVTLFATFSRGESEIDLPIHILDDAIPERTKSLNVSLLPKPSYIIGEQDYAEVAIIDNDETNSLRGYDLWAKETGARSPSEDPDLDHRPNLMEYAVGSDPKIPDEGHFLVSSLVSLDGETFLAATVNRRMKRDDVAYEFDLSENLRHWRSANDQLVVIEDSENQLMIRQSTPVDKAARTYLRLRVSLRRTPWQSSPSLATGFSGAQLFSTFGAIKRSDEPDPCGISGGHPFWFSYQAPRTGRVTVSTDGSDFDTVAAVYTTSIDDFTQLNEIACDNDSGLDQKDSRLSFEAEASQIYFIVVDGVNGESGFVNLTYHMELELSLRILPPFDSSPDNENLYGFVVKAEPGVPFVIESSADMTTWTTLVTTTVSDTGEYEFRDPDFAVGNDPKFFRVYYPARTP